MFLARVIGRVVATQRYRGLGGERFLIVQPVDDRGEEAGDTLIACDVVDSGPGDLVHVCDGREATMALAEPFVPIDATIVGHVEEFALADGRTLGSATDESPARAPARAADDPDDPSADLFGSGR